MRALPLCWVLLLSCLFSGCLWNNQRRAETDGFASLYLSRSFVKGESRYGNIGGFADGFDVNLDWLDCHGGGGSGEELVVILAVVGVVFVGAAVIEGVDHLIMVAPSTFVEVWPEGHEKDYRQFLYWGNNDFYYPETFKGKPIPVIISVSGDRQGEIHLQIQADPDPQKPIKLQH